MNKKITVLSIIIITLINVIMPVAQGVQIITKANLINDHVIKTHIEQENENGWFEVKCNYICYKEEENKYPAYCIMPGTHGVDEEGSYTVTVNKLLNDKLIYNTLINGYPYKTPSQLGLENIDDAYVATKLALKNVLLGRDINKQYKALDSKGEKIIKAMCEIANKGLNGDKLNKEATISIKTVGEFIQSGDYYYQEYNVTSDVNISEYNIKNIIDFPEGSYVVDINGIKKSKFISGDRFRIMIPKTKLSNDINGKINITATCNTNPIFYGEAPSSKIQDYAITYKPYVEYNTSVELNKKTNTSSIKIIKKDKESTKPIKDVEFGLYSIDDEYITSKKTDSEGIAIFSNLYQGKYKIKEITANENYIKDDEVYEITTGYNKEIVKTITNTHKKGNLKIKKVDKDDNRITLGAIEFDLMDENKNVFAHLITDVNGEVFLENINIGNYTLRETLTKKEYNLCVDKNIIVEWGKTTEVVIENEKKKGQIKIIKQDAENKEIKLKGVKFQIVDENNNIVEEIETDENGEAVSSKLVIGKYKIKEIDLGKNIEYLINDKVYTVQVNNEEISELIVENKHKKGNLKIKKVDKDNSNIILQGVKFKIEDKDGFIYEAITNEEGIAEVNNIRVGNIKIKEIETNEEYVLNEEIFETEVKYNECIEVILRNEKKKGQVEIYKTDKDDENIKIEDVEFEILDKNNNMVEKITTNQKGYAISKKMPIGKYYIKETKSNNKYVLNKEVFEINIEHEEVLRLNIENEKIKGKIKIIKTSSNDSPILNIKQGDALKDVKFEIFDSNNQLVDILITDEKGQAISKDLEVGRYKIIEKSTNKYYILNQNEFFVNIKKNGEIKLLKIKNEAIIPKLDIEKTGEVSAEKNEEIKYEFDISNKSNTNLDNFIWKEYIPYEYCKVTKIVTGIYNENIDYKIYYKTNKSNYRLLKEVNSLTSEYINFDDLNLDNKEIITEIKVEYGTVIKDFKSIMKPCVFIKVDNEVKKDNRLINITELSGNIEDYTIKDKSSFETIITEKEILKKLPKTGC